MLKIIKIGVSKYLYNCAWKMAFLKSSHICVHTYVCLPLLQSDDTSASKKDIGVISNDPSTVRILMPLINM